LIGVVGAGKSGISVANHATGRGEKVLLFDDMDPGRLLEGIRSLLSPGVELVQGMPTEGVAGQFDYLVVSPGVPLWKLPLSQLGKRGVEVLGEVEYAFRNIEGKIVAITGTNGKSTVTALTGMMLEKENFKVFTGGNLNDPLTLACGGDYEVYVVELSSFQLETVKRFRPHVGVLLNVGEDHMDRYKSFEEYQQVKGKLFINQDEEDFAVYSASDPLTYALVGKSRGKKYCFSATEKLEEGAWISGNEIHIQCGGLDVSIDMSGFKLEGLHNRENAAAASLAASLSGATAGSIREALSGFRGLPHRMEFAGTVQGVDFYNDSKGTNVHALCSALRGIERKVVLIAGGKDKGLSFEPAEELMRDKVRHMILIGESALRIREELGKTIPCKVAGSMENAVREALESANPGDMVLLSPGCSSFDMFENFEKRGDAFKGAVWRLSKNE